MAEVSMAVLLLNESGRLNQLASLSQQSPVWLNAHRKSLNLSPIAQLLSEQASCDNKACPDRLFFYFKLIRVGVLT